MANGPMLKKMHGLRFIIVADKFCGKILWVDESEKNRPIPYRDIENPDKSLRDRTLAGLPFLKGFEFDGDDKWEDGKIYDPENGKTYSCYMKLKDESTLEVRGFIGFSWIGRTEVWTRID